MQPPTDDWRRLFPELAADPPGRTAILDERWRVRLPADQTVFTGGTLCANYLLLLSGSVRVQMIGEEGREALLYRVLPGHSCVLTTCCLLAGDIYPAEGRTESAVEALSIPKPLFDRTIGESAIFRRFVFANLGARMAEVIARMEQVAFQPVERRLVSYLLHQSGDGGVVRKTHQEIAVELGSVREVVSRHLKRLEARGLLRLGRSTVELLDPAMLERLR
ncbi:MAG: Crp/Fnr family transcriptional regulator [Gammaproteobacteria bacterium]|nr:Crp/Fnr family transcriptional regulator [Gammaproteobacteria bacterium]